MVRREGGRVRIGMNGVMKERVRACVDRIRGVMSMMKDVYGEVRCVGDGEDVERRFVGERWCFRDDGEGRDEVMAMVASEVVRGCGEKLFLGNARGTMLQIDVHLPVTVMEEEEKEREEDPREMCVRGVIDAARCFALAMHDEVRRRRCTYIHTLENHNVTCIPKCYRCQLTRRLTNEIAFVRHHSIYTSEAENARRDNVRCKCDRSLCVFQRRQYIT